MVLLVDDEPSVLSALRRTLRREPYAIETAPDARTALERLAASPAIDAIVSDHNMPGASGVELLTRARRDAPATVRILLSGFTEEIPRAALDGADARAVLSKPWDDAELKRILRQAVGAR